MMHVTEIPATAIVAQKRTAAADHEAWSFVRAAYFPVQHGLRFSRNELTPSRKSAVVRMRAFSSVAAAICRSSSAAEYRLRRRLVASSEAGLFCKRLAANWRVRGMSLSGGTI